MSASYFPKSHILVLFVSYFYKTLFSVYSSLITYSDNEIFYVEIQYFSLLFNHTLFKNLLFKTMATKQGLYFFIFSKKLVSIHCITTDTKL